MKEYYINVNFEDNTIETDLKELVQNDYNSIRLNFEFDIEYDTAMFELKYPNGDTSPECQAHAYSPSDPPPSAWSV